MQQVAGSDQHGPPFNPFTAPQGAENQPAVTEQEQAAGSGKLHEAQRTSSVTVGAHITLYP